MKKKIILTVLVVIVLCMIFLGIKTIKTAQNGTYTPQQNLNAPIEIPDEYVYRINEIENDNKPQVVLFYADWCGYCRRFMPVFGKFAKKYKDKYSFVIVNVDHPENTQMVKKFHIMGFPSLFIVDNEIGHRFSLNMAASGDESVLTEELENYIKVKQRIIEEKND